MSDISSVVIQTGNLRFRNRRRERQSTRGKRRTKGRGRNAPVKEEASDQVGAVPDIERSCGRLEGIMGRLSKGDLEFRRGGQIDRSARSRNRRQAAFAARDRRRRLGRGFGISISGATRLRLAGAGLAGILGANRRIGNQCQRRSHNNQQAKEYGGNAFHQARSLRSVYQTSMRPQPLNFESALKACDRKWVADSSDETKKHPPKKKPKETRVTKSRILTRYPRD